MKLVKYRPVSLWRDLDNLHEELSRFLGGNDAGNLFASEAAANPSIDLWEDKDNVYLEADLPGFNEKDINLKIEGDYLSLSARREAKNEEKKKDFYRCERFSGSFFRQIPLPSAVDVGKINATYKNGVLKVSLPKSQAHRAKEIEIKGE